MNVSNVALFNGASGIFNNSNGFIKFSGQMTDGALIKRTGSGSGDLLISENTKVLGTSEFYNEGSGSIEVNNGYIPDGFICKNKSKYGKVKFFANNIMNPNTEFVVENLDNSSASFEGWSNLNIKNTKITFSGKGSGGAEFAYSIGGNLNLDCEGPCIAVFYVNTDDWHNNTLRYNVYYKNGYVGSKYLEIWTSEWGPYLDVDSVKFISLSGYYADNTRIHVIGDSNYGAVYLYGSYSGTVEIEYNGSSGSYLYFYNNLGSRNNIVFNAPNMGSLKIYSNVDIKGRLTVNNYSGKYVFVCDGVTIGDGAIINVSAANTKDIKITTDIPAGAVVNY